MKKLIVPVSLIVLSLFLIVLFLHFFNRNQEDQSAGTELKHVTLRLQWTTQTQFAGYYVALKKGFYNEAGLRVSIEPGGYGQNPNQTVGAGLEEFGTKWPADLVASQDESLVSLANIVKDNGLNLISRKEKGIVSVEDFRGKKVAIWFIGNEYQLFALLDLYGLSREDMTIVSQKWDMSQFLNDEVDVAAVMTYNELLTLKSDGFDESNLNIMSFAEQGIGFPGHNIFTTREYLSGNPDICKSFVDASIRGWEYAISHPEEATDIVMSYDQEGVLNRDHQLRQMLGIIDLIQPDEYEIGLHLDRDYNLIGELYRKYGIIDQDFSISDSYTNKFIK
ncbi:MAG: ABC transporter substrate-binding protein [Spirochaetales bacterium]|nr:ABC transporter substrate-binding protein [Spirochaetales bacterium]